MDSGNRVMHDHSDLDTAHRAHPGWGVERIELAAGVAAVPMPGGSMRLSRPGARPLGAELEGP